MRELRNDLGQTFGTKKAKKAIASLTENAISPIKSAQGPNSTPRKIDAAARLVLESMEGATKAMATREELEAAINDAKPRPKANLAAENVGDVYTVESLIGLDIMKLVPVKEWQDSVKAKKEVITSSKFVAHRLLKVSTDVQRMRVLRYLLCLLDFFGASKPKGKAGRMVPRRDDLRNALTGIPEAVVENIRRKFSDGGIMLKKHVDLLITHVCALALLVDNFEVDMFDLKEDLKLEIKEISQYFHEIGSRIVAAGVNETKKLGLDKAAAAQHKFAKLKLPLDFPKAKFARKG
jgi:DNA-directed RNA polymerase I subunit RPA49